MSFLEYERTKILHVSAITNKKPMNIINVTTLPP